MPAEITEVVKNKYGAVAASSLSNDHAGVHAVAEAFGYSADELSSIPAEANMGLSCGNPTAMANLRPGETVVDLGCGGGLDVFLAAGKVGPTGKSIGIDMTPEMIARAQKNAANGPGGQPWHNVEFHLAGIEKMPLADNTADVIVSNCVINLAPDKAAVFREIHRVLKPGGRLAISDIALKRSLPPEIADDVMAYVGCIAGAVLIEQYTQQLLQAGFDRVEIVDARSDLNAYAEVEGQSACCPPPMIHTPAASVGLNILPSDPGCCTTVADDLHTGLAGLLRRYDINNYAASVKVFALKPKA